MKTDSKSGTSKYASGASFAQSFRVWWFTQARFVRQQDFAQALGVSFEALQQWMKSRAFPTDPLCDKLFEATQLPCFSSAGRMEARREHEQKKGLSRSAIQKREKRQFLTAEEHARCQADPELAFTIRGDEWIACLECGQLLQHIRDFHLRQHNMTAEQYRVGPDPVHARYGKNRPLVSNALAAKKRADVVGKGYLRPDAGLANLRPPEKGRTPLPPEFFRKQGARRGARKPEWAKDIADVEFVWAWLIEDKSIREVTNAIAGLSPDGKFTIGGTHGRLTAILGMPIRKDLLKEPDAANVSRSVEVLQECRGDSAKLKSEVSRLCQESREEIAAQNKRGGVAMTLLCLPKVSAWLSRNENENLWNYAAADVARRFLADRGWMPTKRRHRRMLPRFHGPVKALPEETAWFETGKKVEELVAQGASVIDARRKVVGQYEYETVVRYHLRYRKHLRAQPSPSQ